MCFVINSPEKNSKTDKQTKNNSNNTPTPNNFFQRQKKRQKNPEIKSNTSTRKKRRVECEKRRCLKCNDGKVYSYDQWRTHKSLCSDNNGIEPKYEIVNNSLSINSFFRNSKKPNETNTVNKSNTNTEISNDIQIMSQNQNGLSFSVCV